MSTFSPAQQMLHVKKLYNTKKTNFYPQYMIIEMNIKPSELSQNYPIMIKYFYDGVIDTWVMGNLEKISEPNFPHVYATDKLNGRAKLCLFLPKSNEWNMNKLIATTIIPWISDWLYYYELWLATGVWSGGGEHPENNN